MSSLDKSLGILARFTVVRPALSVTEAAVELGLPKSSASRLMKAMAQAGLLERHVGTLAYVPGVLAFQLGNLYHANLAIQSFVDTAVQALVAKFGLTFYVGVLSGQDIVLTGVFQGTYPIRMVLPKGHRLPAQVTALGLALLSRKTNSELRQIYFAQVDHKETNVTLTPDDIVGRAETVRSLGYAAVDGSAHRGFSAIGVAVDSVSERQSIAYSVSYPTDVASTHNMEEIAAAILASAFDVGRRVADPYWISRPQVTGKTAPMQFVMKGGEPVPAQ